MPIDNPKDETSGAALSRRSMLMRLGLAATAAYAAPVMLKLGDAHASGGSGGGRGRGAGRAGAQGAAGRAGVGRGGRGSFSGFGRRRASTRQRANSRRRTFRRLRSIFT